MWGRPTLPHTNKMKKLICCLLLLVASSVFASTTGLLWIPTTDTAGNSVWSVGLQFQTTSFTDQYIITEFTIKDRLELGVDYNFDTCSLDNRAYFNAKYVFFKSDKLKLNLAAGFYGMDENGNSVTYAMACRDFKYFRLHGGVQHEILGNHNNYIVGVDKTFSNGIQLMTDYTHGNQNFSSVGVAWYIGKNWIVMGGPVWSNAPGSHPMVLIRLMYLAPYKKG